MSRTKKCNDPNCKMHLLPELIKRIGGEVPVVTMEEFAQAIHCPFDQLQEFLDRATIQHNMDKVYRGEEKVLESPVILKRALDCGKHQLYELRSLVPAEGAA